MDLDAEDRERIGVLIGCGAGGLPETDQQSVVMNRRGALRISPFYIPVMLVNMCSANVSRVFGLLGYTNTCVTACAASTQAIGEAAEVIRRGAADVILTGGAEAGICELGMGGFSTIHGAVNSRLPPEEASRPFDADRDGFVPAEGSAMFVMESLEHARARGAEVYAEVTGWGVSSDAFHLVQPHDEGKGAALAIKLALEDAERNIDDIDYINAHGTSTPLNDKSETLAIKRAFWRPCLQRAGQQHEVDDRALLGSVGRDGSVGLHRQYSRSSLAPDNQSGHARPRLRLDYIPNTARETKVDATLSNSFGFGGQNACLVIEKLVG